MTPTVRAAVPADRAALLDLWVEAWAAARPEIDFEARRTWLDAHLADILARGAALLVACDAAGIGGFVTVDPATRDLDQLAVARERQGQGFATLLIEAAKAMSPGGLTLSVNADNMRALAVYARAGFVVTGQGSNPRSGLPVQFMAWLPHQVP